MPHTLHVLSHTHTHAHTHAHAHTNIHKILQWWIPYVSIHSATNVITCARLRLKQMWRLTKAKTEMKCEHWTKRWNWSSYTKLALRASWTHGLIIVFLIPFFLIPLFLLLFALFSVITACSKLTQQVENSALLSVVLARLF